MSEIIANNLIVSLSNSGSPISGGATSFTVVYVSGGFGSIPSVVSGNSMRFWWDGEIIVVNINSGAGNVNFTSVTRGAEGTTAISHADLSKLYQIMTAAGLAQSAQDNAQTYVRSVSEGSGPSVMRGYGVGVLCRLGLGFLSVTVKSSGDINVNLGDQEQVDRQGRHTNSDVNGTLYAATKFADNETPSGSLNGSNQVYKIAHTPVVSSLQLYYNGVLQLQGTDYTISGVTITFVNATPDSSVGEWIRSCYRY